MKGTNNSRPHPSPYAMYWLQLFLDILRYCKMHFIFTRKHNQTVFLIITLIFIQNSLPNGT